LAKIDVVLLLPKFETGGKYLLQNSGAVSRTEVYQVEKIIQPRVNKNGAVVSPATGWCEKHLICYGLMLAGRFQPHKTSNKSVQSDSK
jgi:hypothetical protein